MNTLPAVQRTGNKLSIIVGAWSIHVKHVSNENQAIDRSHRIGQKRNVMPVRVICPDTVEEKILQLQESKRQLSDQLIQIDSSFFKAITKAELLHLMNL